MVNGSSCQVCAWTLRWAPEQMAWVCDRCGAVVPAQPAAQPAYAGAPPSAQQGQPAQQGPSGYAQQGQPAYPPHGQPAYPPQGQPAYPPHGQPAYPPHGQPAYPPHGQPTSAPPSYPPQAPAAHAAVAPRNKSSKALWIAIGGAIVVAGVIVVIVLATRGGGSADSASDETSGSAVANADKATDKADKATDKADKATDKADKATDKADTTTDKPAGPDGYAVMLAKMSAFKDRACACKDKACIDVLQADMVRWSTDQAKNPPKLDRVDEAAVKQMSTVMDAYTKCLTDVLVASAGGATSPSHVGSAAATPTAALAVGDRVMARWTNGRWYPGKIGAVRSDGTYDIKYDDGDRSNALAASNVRKQTTTTSSSTNSTSKSSSSSSSNAPCPGPGLTRRCNGVCVNIQENNNHCGGCNNRCPSGKSCDGHMFCRDAQGNL